MANSSSTSSNKSWQGYIVCASAFVINSFVMGVSNNFGIMLPTLLDEFKVGRTLTALVGSLQFSLCFMLGPIAVSLIDRFGCRTVSIAGGLLYSVGLMSASFATTIYTLFLTYSIIFGVACCLLWCSYIIASAKCLPSKHQTFAIAVVSCGGAFGMLTFAPLLASLLQTLQWPTTFRILAYLGVLICLLSLSFCWLRKDYEVCKTDAEEDAKLTKNKTAPFIDFSACKIPRFVLYLCGTGISMLGYSVGIFYLADRAKTYGISENKSKWFYSTIGISVIISLLVCGRIGDATRHRVFLNLLSLFLHGITTLLSFLCQTYTTLFIYSLISGIFIGSYNALICVAVLDCVGPEKFVKALGFINFSQGFSLSLGAPIAGMLKDMTGTFKLPLVIAGCLEIAGVLIASPAAFVTVQSERKDDEVISSNIANKT